MLKVLDTQVLERPTLSLAAFGLTQIFKTAMAIDNTTNSTILKYEPNEFTKSGEQVNQA